MTLKQIKYFEAVCETRNVTKAADSLYISRSVVSRALKELENEFGVELFNRTHLGLELTESGKLLKNMFFEFSSVYASIQERIRQNNCNNESRVLTVGITQTCGKRLYPRLFVEFNRKYPEAQFNTIELSAYESHSQVTTGSIDFFFTPEALRTDSKCSMIGELPLYSSQTVFCTARGSRLSARSAVTPREIMKYPMAMLSGRPPIEWPLNIVLRTSQHVLIKRAILSGLAYAILPLDMIEDWDGVVGIPFEPPLTFTNRLIWNKAIPHSQAFNDFLEFMQNYNLTDL
jgi:DNA-binding transcriptional LysR family regulator